MVGKLGGEEKALTRTARNLILLIGRVWRGHWLCLPPAPHIRHDQVRAGSRHTAATRFIVHSKDPPTPLPRHTAYAHNEYGAHWGCSHFCLGLVSGCRGSPWVQRSTKKPGRKWDFFSFFLFSLPLSLSLCFFSFFPFFFFSFFFSS